MVPESRYAPDHTTLWSKNDCKANVLPHARYHLYTDLPGSSNHWQNDCKILPYCADPCSAKSTNYCQHIRAWYSSPIPFLPIRVYWQVVPLLPDRVHTFPLRAIARAVLIPAKGGQYHFPNESGRARPSIADD